MMRKAGIGAVIVLALLGGWFLGLQGREVYKDLAFLRAARYAEMIRAQQRAAKPVVPAQP